MSVFLLYLNTAQKVDTIEHGMVRGLAIADPTVCESRALAKDYLSIEAGDEVIACNGDGIRWQATIDEVVNATIQEDEGEVGAPVRILKGSLTARGGRSVAAACKRMKDNGVELPDIINSRGSGFKQGALAELLTEVQAAELSSGLS
ncbi:MAG: hypothetical protein KTR32_21820 [Granulosicoccus sp.]|nr:hypothetical protein [Granulosicoccus sp.]